MEKHFPGPILEGLFSKFTSKYIENHRNLATRTETELSLSRGALANIENATIHLDKSRWKNTC